jgi:hypothetical protein
MHIDYFFNFTSPLRCLRVPPGVRVRQVKYHWTSEPNQLHHTSCRQPCGLKAFNEVSRMRFILAFLQDGVSNLFVMVRGLERGEGLEIQ